MSIVKVYANYIASFTDHVGGASVFNLDVPSGAIEGDKVLLALAIRDDRTFDAFAGSWTQLFQTTDPSTGVRLGCWWATISGADIIAGEFLGFTCSGGTTTWAGAVSAYTADATFASGSADGGNLSTPALSVPSATLADQATGIIYVGGARSTGSVTFTAPSGFTERADVTHTVSPTMAVTIADKLTWTFGDLGPWTAVATGSPSKMAAGWVVIYGTLDYVVPELPNNPNTPLGFDVPFLDGVHTVYAGWGGAAFLIEANLGGSAFRLNDDTLGLLNVGRLGPAEDGWVDIGGTAQDVRAGTTEITGSFGATQDDGVLTRVEASTAQLVIKDWNGYFDPLNLDSPYYLDWQLGTEVRMCLTDIDTIDGTHNPATDNVLTTMRGLFHGRVSSMTATGTADEDPVVTVALEDDTSILAAYQGAAQTPVGAGDTLAVRVQRVLDEVSYQGPALALDDFHPEYPATQTFAATDLSQSAWSEILTPCDAVLVAPVFEGDGTLTLHPMAPNTSDFFAFRMGYADDGEIPLVDVTLTYDRAQLRNAVSVGKTGGPIFNYQDTASIGKQGGVWRWASTDLPLQLDADVEAMGQKVLAASSNPGVRITGIEVFPQIHGNKMMADTDLYVAGDFVFTDSQPVWYMLARMLSQRCPTFDLLHVRFRHPMTGRETSQLVQCRGADVLITADEFRVRFVTSAVDGFFDIWTLSAVGDTIDEAELSRLSRGHHLAAA